jgi:filamentous hemagglutinin
VEGANFAQRTFSSTFRGGALAGRSISDVAGDLGSVALTPKDVPVGMIVRDGDSLILNTRSAQALMQAGIPRSAWSVIDQTGDPFFEELLTGQLTRNGLDSGGFGCPTPSGGC